MTADAKLEVRVTEAELTARVAELGRDVADAYAGTEPLFVTVLRGGAFFLADLVRNVALPLELDFMSISTYGRGGTVRILKDLTVEVRARHVLVVEDVVDTGLTLAYLLQVLAAREPASLRVCTLFDRRVRRIAELPLDFVGYEVGDEFLVGYGLDLDEGLRGLAGVVAVGDRDAARAAPAETLSAARALVSGTGG